ncbi:MAG: SRPBCC domain-containing protein [Dehalococcoidia bacterium]|nr:SRPBCC domain-containing protein [Dehalococcoidia bacterium]
MSDRARVGSGRDLVVERVFDAPREVMWKAWTEPERLARWFGPKDYTIASVEIDLRVGGRLFFSMQSPEGQLYWHLGVFEEIVPLERIVYKDSFADAEGKVVPASHYGMAGDIPLERRVTVTFADTGGKTRTTLRHEGLPGPAAEGAGAGWSQSFEKLSEYLAAA